ncbi:dethiobiotin synthase [Helicobacter ailurogastricus]|uniref:ATP-dependent dethiobiotin synthetase BioD n=1 Tax=Helicobacter ailurogastricus TaxID=1578720 RepID=A0A0K2XZW8_9HELI|nr:dethiobiotin synthase [Helicobacter ailurogastricus]BDQ29329.1 ATP-dependent dethiobiotin synthetase BioD [Helicobacter ailurogastricus]GLH57409.1 Dethiobiotin synthetase BioD [Helicobacter ailurogastricus]GLH58781.1 Dethiobiotin synthetase BioD [Helicobacter ailurogastricus]CRF52208.1 Dethiobiotin synthetase [Helicobacter ailurogastricus]
MHRPIFVSATNTDMGKTTIALKLAKLYNERGIKTFLVKPIETGINTQETSDAETFLEENQHIDPDLTLDDISFYRFVLAASPFVASRFEPHLPPIDFKHIEKKLKALQERCDLLIIEGVGGLLVPLDEKVRIVDLALHLKTKLLLISASKLGMLNDLLLNLHYLSAGKIPCQIAINMLESRAYYQTNKPYIDYLNNSLKDPILVFQEQQELLLNRLLES